MSEIEGRGACGAGASGGASLPRIEMVRHLRKVAETITSRGGKAESHPLRLRLGEIGARAEELQHAAGEAGHAVDALSAMEDTLYFALEAAREARGARTLPGEVLEELQKQVDLAVTGLERCCREAAYRGSELLRGGRAIQVGGENFQLPRLSAAGIGGNWVAVSDGSGVSTGEVEYSQSVASVLSGGPNCLERSADGAAMSLESGIEQVSRLRAAVEDFCERTIVPAVGELAVTLTNALACESAPGSFEEAARLLEQVKDDLQASPDSSAAKNPRSVLRLLE